VGQSGPAAVRKPLVACLYVGWLATLTPTPSPLTALDCIVPQRERMGKTKARAEAGLTSFENPMDEEEDTDADSTRLATFEQSFDAEASAGPPAKAMYPESPASARPAKSPRMAAKKRAMAECAQLLGGGGSGLQTDWFEYFSTALTTISAQWDPAADLFKQLDDDGSGELARAEVRTALRERLSAKQIKQAFDEMDADGGGTIDIDEFRDWWEKRVISPSGSFHSVLGQMSREQTKQEMRKCFETSELPGGELSAFISLGGKFDAPMEARDFWDSIEMHLAVRLSKADRAQLEEELYSERPKTPSGETDRTEMYTMAEFLAWWELFFEFDAIDPYQAAMQLLQDEKKLINPFAKFRGDWDLAQTIMLFYIMMAVPYRIGFDDDVVLWSIWFWLDVIIDLYFITDVIVNFRTAVVQTDGKILFRQHDIALHYTKTWLFVDVFSCLPLGYIAYWQGEAASSEHRTLKLLRLLRLLRLARIKRIFDRWEETLYGVQWFKMLKVVVSLVGCAHWLACMWYYFGQADLPPNTPEHLAGAYESKGWVLTKYVDWTNYTAVTLADRYFDSFFWGMSTSLMVSSSDDPMSPTTVPEKLTFLISFFVGALLFSFIIGTVSDLIAHANPGVTARNDAIGVVNTFLAERGIKPALLRRTRAHVKTLFEERGTHHNIADIMTLLPYHVQVELGAQLRFIDDPETSRRSAFARIPFFKDLGTTEMLAIGCRLRHVRHIPPIRGGSGSVDRAAYIMREGDRGVEMWVVIDGVVGIERGTGAATEDLGKLREGDYFGEMAVLCQERPGVPLRRGRSAFAVSAVLLYSLTYSDVLELRREHPQIDAAVYDTTEKLRKAQPELFPEDTRAIAAQRASSVGEVAELRKEIAELREGMSAGFEALQVQVAALSK
jgi:CRP-like cAMP-binding protein